jgi:hypothetical protein
MILGAVLNNALKIRWIKDVFTGSAMLGGQYGLFLGYSYLVSEKVGSDS